MSSCRATNAKPEYAPGICDDRDPLTGEECILKRGHDGYHSAARQPAMPDAEAVRVIRAAMRRTLGPFEWPTDGCGYEQHMRFVSWRNRHWPVYPSGMTFAEFVEDYCVKLLAGEVPAFENGKVGTVNATQRDPKAAGSAVTCVCCGRTKAPRGRDVSAYGPDMCGHGCPGYLCRPLPGSLWPGETREEFGYPCSTADELADVGPVYVPGEVKP